MAAESTEIDVLVVGAGPTGLTMANELLRRGLTIRVIDQIDVPSDKSRALAVHARTLELFQKIGIAEELIETGTTTLQASIYVKGSKKVDVECGNLNFSDTPYPFVLFTSQVETETILERNFQKLGGKVERSTELLQLSQNENKVTATIRTRQGEEKIDAKYLVGCDGAHSKVRKALGLVFEGAAYEQDFMLADVEVDWDLAPDRFRMFFGRSDLLAIFPMKGNLVRLIGTRTESPNKESDPTLTEVEAFAREVTRKELTLTNPVWVTRFRLHHRGVDRYAQGRCFVAGDAAHIHSPAGGQGMNTGIQDAYNLAWKLEWVIKQKAPERLLATYHQERYPVGRFLLRFTDRLFQLGSSPNRLVLFVRNHLFWRFAKFALASPKRRSRALRTISQLGIRYRPNAFMIESAKGEKGPKVGERAPDVKIGKTSLFTLLLGTEAHLFCFNPAEGEPLKDGHYKIHRLTKNSDTEAIFQRFGVDATAYYFIRPDGHVGFRSFGESTEGLRNYLHSHQVY